MDLKTLVCINDGDYTGMKWVLDLTLVSSTLSGVTNWEVLKKCSTGSDNFSMASSIISASRIRKLYQGSIGK